MLREQRQPSGQAEPESRSYVKQGRRFIQREDPVRQASGHGRRCSEALLGCNRPVVKIDLTPVQCGLRWDQIARGNEPGPREAHPQGSGWGHSGKALTSPPPARPHGPPREGVVITVHRKSWLVGLGCRCWQAV